MWLLELSYGSLRYFALFRNVHSSKQSNGGKIKTIGLKWIVSFPYLMGQM